MAHHNVISLHSRRPASHLRSQNGGQSDGNQLDLWPAQPQPHPQPRPASAAQPSAAALRPPPALRVTRIVDAGHPGAIPGPRLRITGRLIDVCAELDRLAAAEARAA